MKYKSFLLIFINLLLIILFTACDVKTNFNITYIYNDEKTIVNYEEGTSISTSIAISDSKFDIEDIEGAWFSDINYQNEIIFPYKVIKDINFYFAKNEYNVNFYVDDELYETQKIERNKIIKEIDNPIKKDYTFVGWTLDKNNNNIYNSSTAIKKDIDLYAIFDEGATYYDVLFKDTEGLLKTIKVQDGFTIDEYIPTKDNYEYSGWYTDKYYKNKFDYNTKITNKTTLYTKWNPKSYRISYYVDNELYETENVLYNNYAKFTSIPSKDGYTFVGWVDDDFFDFDLENTKITNDVNLYATFEEFNEIKIDSYQGYNEGIYVILPKLNVNLNKYEISYSKANLNQYIEIDNELIREENNKIRADILGLTKGKYDIKIKISNVERIIEDIDVYQQDRSGYAHFNYTSGVGAYNDDGSLKNNTIIVYVTDETKNTVEATINGTTYKGLVKILQAQQKSKQPLDIRILNTIKTPQWNSKKYTSSHNTQALIDEIKASFKNAKASSGKYYAKDLIAANANSYSDDLALGITQLEGLTSWGSTTDSYWNMCDVENASNLTIEGVGEEAGIFQWGFNFKKCLSIEVKNLKFDSYTEDACSSEGAEESDTISGFSKGRLWIHNNTFTKGSNRWDVSDDQDKYDGDGATDFKKLAYVTLSYNHYIKNHKTGLIGGSDSQRTAAITFHHNFYDECQSRLPFARQANMHMYNNYYYKSTGNNMQIYAGAYAFIENCLFENVKKPFEIKEGDGKVAAVKLYNNLFSGCSSSAATTVSSRTVSVSNDCLYGNRFDTDSSIFYYDSTNQKSKVTIMNNANDIKTIIPSYAGAGTNYYKSILS